MKRILFALFIAFSLVEASTQTCLDLIDLKSNSIISRIVNNGYVYLDDCSDDDPYLHIVLVNLDDSTNQISITHFSKTDRGYPLKTITELAKYEGAVVAVNGFTWIGDQGYKSNQFAKEPAGTVYSKGKKVKVRGSNGEVVLGFAERDYNGTKPKLIDRSQGEVLQTEYLENADNSTDSIIKHSAPSAGDTSFQTSSIGIGKLNGMNILIILSACKSETASLKEHEKIFEHFNGSEAMRLDGNSATSLFVNGKHINELGDFHLSAFSYARAKYQKRAYGKARHIMYAITVKKVPAIEPPEDNNSTNDNNNTGGDNNTTDPTRDPNKVCVSNFFKYYGDGTIHDSLKKGDKDAELYDDGTKHQVKELQEFLEDFGYDVGSSGADGWFGGDTKTALVDFQSNNGLDADGIVGPNTRDAMNGANCYDKE